ALSIDDQAFYNCSGLATITMNEGLVTIGNEVFWNNSGIMQFSIPGTVTKMGRNCFYGCTRTSYLTFRDGEETLAIDNSGTHSSIIDAKTSNSSYTNRYYDYFYDCPIRFLTLGRNLTYSSTNNQSMYDFDGSSFNSVSRASAPFVNKTELRSVTIGPKVTFLYNHLFDGCINITKLSFPAGLTSVYSYALANCDGLTALDFPEQVISLGSCVCENDINLESVLFREEPNNNLSFTIGSWGFSNCPKLTTLTFPAKTTSIGHFCFANDISLKELIFTDSPKTLTLGSGALNQSVPDYNIGFFGNSRLESLYIGRNITYTASPSYGYSPFYNQQFLTDVRFSQAGTVTFCHDYLLYGVNNCKELILPESLQTIGSRTFANMTILEGITIPNKVTEIGTYAFSEDKTLKYAKLSTSCPWLKEGLFNSCDSLESIFIPAIVTKMDTRMFANCKSLASATFEGNSDILEMGYGASNSNYGLFRDCPLETLNLDRWITYDTNQPSYAPFYSIKELKNLSLGENVGIIDKYMFAYCTGLEELYLPDTIESVGLWGFRGCSSLKKVRFSEKLSQVSDFGFSECTSLDNVIFPASMTSIADNSFSNCTSLKTLDLGKSLMIIGPSAFKNDGALEGIEIPETLYGLGVEAFANCTSLPYVAIKAISSVGRQAFEGCTGLQWVSLSEKTTSLGENSFAGCSDIKYIKSYAQLPPEGLVNFVESVPENGTLFVPESSLDYYQYSPTWENWLDIRPLNDNVLVSSITLDKSEISFKATDTATLSVTVGADDATDKEIIWRTSDEQIASVDNDGIVTAIAVGEAIITALAADGSGIKAECKVTVNPTLVESIAINSATSSLKKGRTLELSASVAPATATNQEIIWSSSNPSIATVDDKGNVTAISAGDVNILATAADESGMDTLYALSVVPPTKGDSNDNDAVTITDAVNTANYAVGNEVENFCFEGA
ncbi:MAG: leucine-rich repeat protein, partial [Muribaculaceae bacterium]|nr:leucine-rich repeat protein [Muribaculaceae bacterium]